MTSDARNQKASGMLVGKVGAVAQRESEDQLSQLVGSCIEGLRFLAEGEAHLLGSVARIAVEARARHAGHADFLYQILGERHVVFIAKGRDISHDVVRAPWNVPLEAGG